MNRADTGLKLYDWNELDQCSRQRCLQRPARQRDAAIDQSVAEILAAVRERGNSAVREFGARFDGVAPASLEVDPACWQQAMEQLPDALLQAMERAATRIRRFHEQARPVDFTLATDTGVECRMRHVPIRRVGLYVPAGSAPLPSTVLMLAIPARAAGCGELILCSPPGAGGLVDLAVLAAARMCGVDRVFAAGGAQAIAAMAFGTESIPHCEKLFGPGNRYVTAAKQQVSIDPGGAAIDMPAGPSEVLVIADGSARVEWVAADLLSQAEHGPDSQVLLVATDAGLIRAVVAALEQQLARLPRAAIAAEALGGSRAILVRDLEQAVEVSNHYAPEHLIIASDRADELLPGVRAAGAVFLGHYTPESLGDYCSGTNHVLPTAGWARSHGSLSTADFMLRMTVQRAGPEGLERIGPDAMAIARHEQLDAHAEAVRIRLEDHTP